MGESFCEFPEFLSTPYFLLKLYIFKNCDFFHSIFRIMTPVTWKGIFYWTRGESGVIEVFWGRSIIRLNMNMYFPKLLGSFCLCSDSTDLWAWFLQERQGTLTLSQCWELFWAGSILRTLVSFWLSEELLLTPQGFQNWSVIFSAWKYEACFYPTWVFIMTKWKGKQRVKTVYWTITDHPSQNKVRRHPPLGHNMLGNGYEVKWWE